MKLARILLLVCLAVSLLAVAQEKKPTSGAEKKAAKTPAGMPAMKPSPEIQKLAKALVGTYTTKETHDPGPFMPNGGTGVGESKWSLGPGGNSIVQTYRSRSNAGAQFRGQGIIWWDAKAGGYRGVWCDNMSPACDTAGLSKWDGDKLVGSAETEIMGKKVNMKDTSTFTPDGFKYDMEMAQEGGPMKHAMTIEYVKAQAAPAGEKPAAEKEKKQ